ncbi:alkyl hydroperoxide reductase [Malaciobacter halophilus]|nr:alkyl hydroperoxide reductase [Malaciobacter halophilus]
MLEETKKLESEKLSKNALKVGDRFENEEFTNIDGKNVKLYDYFGDNDFLIINFYRGSWCPYCNLELKSLQGYLDEFEKYNASLIAISPQTPDNSLSTKEKNELEFEVLSDIGNKVAKDLGLVFSLAKELRPIYESFKIDIPNSNNDKTYELPMPATFVINKKGEVIFSFVDEDYTKRYEPEEIVKILKDNLK